MKYHCRGTLEDSPFGIAWIKEYENDIYRVNGVVFIRYHIEFIARSCVGRTDVWYARIDTDLFPLPDQDPYTKELETFEVSS